MGDDQYGLRGPGPPKGGDYNKAPRVLGVAWMEASMCIVAVAGRFWGRYIIHKTSWDDWLMLLTLVC